MRAAVDVMGGDHAPAEILRGCWDAAPLLGPDDQVLLVGPESLVTEALEKADLPDDKRGRYRGIWAEDVIGMDESPVEAVRGKPNSTIAVMAKMASQGGADVCISAGNTGACVAAAQLRMRTLPGVSRPGIAVILPTFHGPVVVCDVGANIAPQPRHLQQYAIMAAEYATAVCGIANPRVGLLSVGEEEAKGTTLVKTTHKLLRDEPQINFIGNVEGRDLFAGVTDVVVCDGFVGNTILKMTEGLSEGLFKTMAAAVKQNAPHLMAEFGGVMKSIKTSLDWQETGGAPLLGVGGHFLISHGRSEARAIMNAVRVAKQLADSGLNEKIVERIASSIPSEDGSSAPQM